MERKWIVRAYKEGDEEEIFKLWKDVHEEEDYPQEKWLSWWRWLYRDTPAGAARIWLADDNGRIAGQYPLILLNLKTGDKVLKIYQNIDVMTHQDYRKQGMFSTLEKHALVEAEKEGIPITIGFPNEAAYPGHMKAGWFDIDTMRVLIRPLNMSNILKTRIKNRFLSKISAIAASLMFKGLVITQKLHRGEKLNITQVSSFDDRIDDFWNRVSNQYDTIIVRNKEHLNWRYSAPGENYSKFLAERDGEVYGYLILKFVQQENLKLGMIFDMFTQSEKGIYPLVSKAIEHCKAEKADLVYHSMIANKTYQITLRRNGFISLPWLKGVPFCAYSSSSEIPTTSLENPQNWFVQIGDSDRL